MEPNTLADRKKLWVYFDAATKNKDLGVLEDPDFESVYQPYPVNRGLSNYEQMVPIANVLNQMPQLSKELQFRFILNTVRKPSGRATWMKKPEVSEDVTRLAEYYDCSIRRAAHLVSLHTPQQLKHIRRILNRGGQGKRQAIPV